jgi:hypothetical protein
MFNVVCHGSACIYNNFTAKNICGKMMSKATHLNGQANYLDARKIGGAKNLELGGYEALKCRASEFRKFHNGHRCLAWTSQILAHPASGARLEKGRDLVDCTSGWILPASYIPEEARGRERVALYFEPRDIRMKNDKTIVHPRDITTVYPFPQLGPESGESSNEMEVWGFQSSSHPLPLDIEFMIDRLKSAGLDLRQDGVNEVLDNLRTAPKVGFSRCQGSAVSPLACDIILSGVRLLYYDPRHKLDVILF